MLKARKRKDTQFDNKMFKCVFLYGEPTNDKAAKVRKMQAEFVKRSSLSNLITRTARCEPLKKTSGLKRSMRHTARMRLIWR